MNEAGTKLIAKMMQIACKSPMAIWRLKMKKIMGTNKRGEIPVCGGCMGGRLR